MVRIRARVRVRGRVTVGSGSGFGFGLGRLSQEGARQAAARQERIVQERARIGEARPHLVRVGVRLRVRLGDRVRLG